MKLFVTNLPRDCTEQELLDHFAQCGTPVSAKIIMDRETGRPRGFGFVEMSSKEEAQKAIEELDEKEFGGRPLVVKEAEDKPKRAPRQNSGGQNRRW